MKKNIWILGEFDNELTNITIKKLIEKFSDYKINLISIKPSYKRDYKRFLNKLKRSSFKETFKRIIEILNRRKRFKKKKINLINKINILFVKNYSSKNILEIIFKDKIKFMLSMTDEIIPHNLIFNLSHGIWNVHPGALPYYSGVGASDRMILDNFLPVLTAHLIDEGIDTGLTLFECYPNYSSCKNIHQLNDVIINSSSDSYVEITKLLTKENKLSLKDFFFEESNICHRNLNNINKIVLNKNIKMLKKFNHDKI